MNIYTRAVNYPITVDFKDSVLVWRTEPNIQSGPTDIIGLSQTKNYAYADIFYRYVVDSYTFY